MVHDFSGRSSGKIPVATERRKGSPIFPDGMFQTEISVPFVQTSSVIPVAGSRGNFSSQN